MQSIRNGGKKTFVQSPKIISQTPMSVDLRQRSLGQSGSRYFFHSNASHSNLPPRQPTIINQSRIGMSKKDQKKAIRNFYNEVQSAVLPEINSAMIQKSLKCGLSSLDRKSNETKDKKVKYVHEEFFDAQSKGKWTIFNKHEVNNDGENSEMERGLHREESILDQMVLEEKLNPSNKVTQIPESTWLELYQAKCQDIGIPSKSDKQQERFVMQMLLH